MGWWKEYRGGPVFSRLRYLDVALKLAADPGRRPATVEQGPSPLIRDDIAGRVRRRSHGLANGVSGPPEVDLSF